MESTAKSFSVGTEPSVMLTVSNSPKRCGLAIIVANSYKTTPLRPDGSKVDVLENAELDATRMQTAFMALNFATHVEKDVGKARMEKLMAEAVECSKMFQCVAFVFSGHGLNRDPQGLDKVHSNFIISNEWIGISTLDVMAKFYPQNAPTIARIPKLFFFDACRGAKTLSTVLVPKAGKMRYPPKGNYLVAYSNMPLYRSYGLPGKGSLWISELAPILPTCHKDIAGVLHEVNRNVIARLQRWKPGYMQQPLLMSCLHGTLVLPEIAGLSPSQVPPANRMDFQPPSTINPYDKAGFSGDPEEGEWGKETVYPPPMPVVVPEVQANSPLDEKPDTNDFTYWEHETTGESFMIIDQIEGKWTNVLRALKLPSAYDKTLKATPTNTTADNCSAAFDKWLKAGKNEYLTPKTWRSVLKVLKIIGEGEFAEVVESVLTGQYA